MNELQRGKGKGKDKPDLVASSGDVLAGKIDRNARKVKVRVKGKGMGGRRGGAQIPQAKRIAASGHHLVSVLGEAKRRHEAGVRVGKVCDLLLLADVPHLDVAPVRRCRQDAVGVEHRGGDRCVLKGRDW